MNQQKLIPSSSNELRDDAALPYSQGSRRRKTALQMPEFALPEKNGAATYRVILGNANQREVTMAKARAKRAKAPESSGVTQAEPQASEAALLPEMSSDDQEPASPAEIIHDTPKATDARQPVEPRRPILTPDPRAIMSASIGDGKGAPRMQLLRSHRYRHYDESPGMRR